VYGKMTLVSACQQRPPRWALILAMGSLVLLVLGVGITVWQWTHPVEFGWFAYAPLSDTIFNPTSDPSMSKPLVLGYCLTVFGALGLGAGAGVYAVVRRGHR
jgi:heme/copper-type cytochrome/quinol oxidase subunit 1